jgi:beta-phosphoglucomutase-like phosphatase (HAD superfamily)
VYLSAIDKLSADPRRSAAVEDSANGLRAAAAGMAVIAVPNREFPPDADALGLADLEIESLEQLTPAAIEALAPERRRADPREASE